MSNCARMASTRWGTRMGWLGLSVMLLCPGLVSTALASGKAPPPPVIQAQALPAPEQGWDAFHLSRALSAWADGDLQSAVDELSNVDISASSGFEQADRAAFLLCEAYLRLGAVEAFLDLAQRVASQQGSTYRQWIGYRALWLGTDITIPQQYDAAPLLGAALLLEAGRSREAQTLLENSQADDSLEALQLQLLATAQEANGQQADRTWQELASRTPESPLEIELVGAAHMALATSAMERGEDASATLAAVPAQSRYRDRALTILALLALEDGRNEDAITALDELIARGDPGAMQRSALLLRSELEMDATRYQAALELLGTAERDWELEWATLTALAEGEDLDRAWAAWETSDEGGSTLVFATEDLEALAARAVAEALDLHRKKDAELRSESLTLLPESPRDPLLTHQPSAADRSDLDTVLSASRRLEVEEARLEHEIEASRQEAQRRLRYLELGSSRTQASLIEMDDALSALAASLARLNATLAAMDSLQADATARILSRTQRLLTELDRDRLFLRALHHFHVDGPQAEGGPPATTEPSPHSVIEDEARLAADLSALAALFGEKMPGLVDRSFDEILEPQLAGGSRSLHAMLLAQRTRAADLAAALDSLSADTGIDPTLLAQRDSLALDSERLAQQEAELRRDIARRVALRGQSALEAEREALDYHLADAAFEHAIALALDPSTSEQPELVQPARGAAMQRLELFLQRHPQSFARAESRFRLADLRLLAARDEFQARMAGFLGENPDDAQMNDRSLAPFVDYAPAIELYREILDQDPDFAHLDAVLFSLGMILSDDGQAEGAEQLTRLVEEYPGSHHAQEAWLRLGDERFEIKDYAAAIPRLENAAEGADPSLSAIALYKLGWAHFEEDRFLDSAEGFRRLLDLYVEYPNLAASTDLRDEAEEYLVHSLARGGGAAEFGPYFDALGGRDYEARILSSMGALLKSYSLYDESIACDRLWLERYPQDAQALALATRMVDSYGRWNKADESLVLRLELAPRFMPGSDWYAANEDIAMRAEADAFAQGSYRDAALQWHHRARESKDAQDWDRALGHYEVFLVHWPQDPESARLHYQAGEAAAELAQYDRAIQHFGVAAADTAEFAQDAAWQRVATADRWYQSSSSPEATSAGPDSLAGMILRLGDEYLGAYPRSASADELRWRQAQLAYLHAWDEDAAQRFALFAAQSPRDERVPLGLRLRGDALHRADEYQQAAQAYEEALLAAQNAGQDSLAASLEPIIPLSWYEHAESIAAADSVAGEQEAAVYFVELARRFPDFEHADLALYRGALGYLEAGEVELAVDAFEEVLRSHPGSEHERDAAIQIAGAYESHDETLRAAVAYAEFSRRFPEDPDAPAALLKAADLEAGEGQLASAEELRSEFLRRYPGEVEAAFEIREARAALELERATAGGVSIAALLGASSASAGTANSAGQVTGSSAAVSELSAYLELAAAHPESASPVILAQVEFLKAEAIYPAYLALKLSQPLPASIEAKKTQLEAVLQAYGSCARAEVRQYTQAAAYRIGEALIAFGDALLESERPTGLSEDELYAYEEVLEEQSWTFFDRGEQAWNELLRQNPVESDDEGGWLVLTREALWPRVARRFVHRPTVEYPLVSAQAPPPPTE